MKPLFLLVIFPFLLCFSTSEGIAQTARKDLRKDSLEAVLSSWHTRNDSAKVQILCELSKEYETRDAVRALVFARQALSLADSLEDPFGAAKAQVRMGTVLWSQGFYEQSVEYYFRALNLAQNLKDSATIARALGGIGANYRKQGNYAKAKDYYTQALTLSTAVHDKRAMESMLNNLGVLHFGEGENDSALVCWQRALDVDVELRDSASIALVSANVAWAFNNLGKTELALRFAEDALAIASSIGDKRVSALSNHVLGEIYAHTQNYQRAESYEREALRLAEEYGGKEIMRWVFESLSLIAERTGRPAQALEFYKDFKEFSDSMHTAETAERTAVLTTQYRDEERLKEIAGLKTRAEEQAKVRNLLLLGLVLLIGLLVIGVNRYQYKRRTEQELLRRQRILDEQAGDIELANTQLAEQNQQLQLLDNEKNEMLGIVAHDLKNPIGAVRSYAEMICYNEIPPEEAQRSSEMIIQTSNRMLDLVNNLLDANAIESGKMKFSLAVFDAAPIVEMLTGNMMNAAAMKEIQLHFSLLNTEATTDSSTTIQVDEIAFMQVIDNILSNAVKYSPLGKHVWVRVGRVASQREDIVRIEIQDEGPGFTDDDKEKLFGKFARLSAKPTGGEHSTGLGLAIVKKLVEQMQGTVRCESQAGHGATFIVEFPAM